MGTSLLQANPAKENIRPQRPPAFPGAEPAAAPNPVQLYGVCPCGGGCPRCAPVQAKLEVGTPDDTYEREADSAARAVLQADEPAAPPDLHPVAGGSLQRERTPSGPPALISETNALVPDEGRPLAGREKSFFEPRFGCELSSVRVHTSPEAAAQAAGLQARAYTVGSHIVFGSGRYQPDQPKGRELMAHELAHTVQQQGNIRCVQRQPEREEERAGWSRDMHASADTLVSSVGQAEREHLGGVYPMLPPELQHIVQLGNLEAGFSAGFISGLSTWVDPKDILDIDRAARENPIAFNSGAFVGLVMGAGQDIYWNLEGMVGLGKLALEWTPVGMLYKSAVDTWDWIRNPAAKLAQDQRRWEMLKETISGLWEFQKYLNSNPEALLIQGRDLGQLAGDAAGKYMMGMIVTEKSAFNKGIAIGYIVGIIAMEMVLLLVSWEKLLGKAAEAAANATQRMAREAALALKESTFGVRVLEIMEHTPGLSKIVKAVAEAEKGGQAAQKGLEASRAEEAVRAAQADRASNVRYLPNPPAAPSAPVSSMPRASEEARSADNVYTLFDQPQQSIPAPAPEPGPQAWSEYTQGTNALKYEPAPVEGSVVVPHGRQQPLLQLVPKIPEPLPAAVSAPVPAAVPGTDVGVSNAPAVVAKAASAVVRGAKTVPTVSPQSATQTAAKAKEKEKNKECAVQPNPTCPNWISLKEKNLYWDRAYAHRCSLDLVNWKGFGQNIAVVFYTQGNQFGEVVMENEGKGGLHSEARVYWELINRGLKRDCDFTILGFLTERRACPSCQEIVADLCRWNHGVPFPVYYLIDYWNTGGFYDTHDHISALSEAYAKAGYNIRKCEIPEPGK